MGMFDTVRVACPVCGALVDEQTKAGECMLAVYSIHDAPPEVLLGIHNVTLRCTVGHEFYIKVQVISHAEIIQGKAPEGE